MRFDYQQLATLSAILRRGSFESAAADLGITQSAVSQRLKALEERVGTLLVHRGQPCVGTDAGRRLAAHSEHVALLESSLDADIQGLGPLPGSRLRIAVNADSLATWFVEAIAPARPRLFELVVDDQDFSVDLLKKGEVAGAVTSVGSPIAGCDCRFLGNMQYVAAASPEFIGEYFQNGFNRDSITKAPMLQFNAKDDLQNKWLETHFGPNTFAPFHLIPSTQAFVEACQNSLGWGLQPIELIEQDLKQGSLVRLMPDSDLFVPLYWQSARLLRPALEQLTRSICLTAHKSLPQ